MYTDLVLYCCCKTVYLVQSQPKLTIQITKAILVIGPAAMEVNRAIQSPLKHCSPPPPPRLSFGHRRLKGTETIRVDCINAACCFTRFVQLSTVLLNCWKT